MRNESLLCAVFLVGMAGVAGAQSSLPDSQVEANVLKALAGAPDLANQSISTNTVYGVVTLSGSVTDDASRVKAENLAANAQGVKKVVDQLSVGAAVAQNGDQSQPGPGMVLQSDGTYAPAQPDPNADPSKPAPGSAPATGAVMNDPDNDQAQYQPQGTPSNGTTGNTAQPSMQPPPAQPANGQPTYPAQGQYPPQGQYPQRGQYPQQGQYPQNGYPAYPQRGAYAQNGGQPWGGQEGGQGVTIPVGTLVRVRVNRAISSKQEKPGDVFDGFVANDVVAGGFVAIPRGAAVQGTVVDAKTSGAISGRGELSLNITSVTLGGKVYPVQSDVWAQAGPSKTGNTVSNAAGFGVAGALIGAIAGRGAGAAIGAGAGAAAGVGVSAAERKGQVVIPPEGMVSFHLASPAAVTTVSEQEIQRLAYGAPQGGPGGYRQPMYARPYGYPAYPPPAYNYPPPQ